VRSKKQDGYAYFGSDTTSGRMNRNISARDKIGRKRFDNFLLKNERGYPREKQHATIIYKRGLPLFDLPSVQKWVDAIGGTRQRDSERQATLMWEGPLTVPAISSEFWMSHASIFDFLTATFRARGLILRPKYLLFLNCCSTRSEL
jgi:hypothetical protein